MSKYAHTIQWKRLANGIERLHIQFEEDMGTLPGFIMIDVNQFPNFFVEGLELLLQGETDYVSRHGNIYGFEGNKEMVSIYDKFADDENTDFYIETLELLHIIQSFLYAKSTLKKPKFDSEH